MNQPIAAVTLVTNKSDVVGEQKFVWYVQVQSSTSCTEASNNRYFV